jgi:tripartite-type tricarboxylate transporter receptor subunit TctC
LTAIASACAGGADYPLRPIRIIVPLAPGGTPREIIGKIRVVIAQAPQQPEVREKLYAQGGEPSGKTADRFAVFLKSGKPKWGQVIRDAGQQQAFNGHEQKNRRSGLRGVCRWRSSGSLLLPAKCRKAQ